jgi:hypothetical protein
MKKTADQRVAGNSGLCYSSSELVGCSAAAAAPDVLYRSFGCFEFPKENAYFQDEDRRSFPR